MLLRDVGKTKEAAEQLQQAVGLAPFVAAYRRELAGALMRFGRSGEAIVHYQAALKISAGDVEAQRGLATALLAEGKTAEAIGYYQAVLKISATDGEAQRGLGLALMARGKVDEAMEVLRKLPAGPKSAAAINQLALALAGKGKTAEATRVWETAVGINARDIGARHNLGGVLLATGHVKEAIVQFREELRLNPGNDRLRSDLAWILATSPDAALRNGKEAVQLAQQAVKGSGGKQPAILDTLAAAYAEAGQFQDAVRTAKEALQQATAERNERLAESLRKRIDLYRENKPCRDLGIGPK